MTVPTTVVVPTVGRPSLTALLQALGRASGPRPVEVLVVDDRPDGGDLTAFLPGDDVLPVRVLRSGGRGPAAARNVGWRHARTEWVSFLDDDVLPDDDWPARLAEDLAGLAADVAASQGRVRVPLPADRRATDWERLTAGLADARWITADISYRRSALVRVGGFDERFPRAFREDADLALRVEDDGGRLVVGDRWITHPVRPVDDWVSLRSQAGNADDPLMTRLTDATGTSAPGRSGGGRGTSRYRSAASALALPRRRRRWPPRGGAAGWRRRRAAWGDRAPARATAPRCAACADQVRDPAAPLATRCGAVAAPGGDAWRGAPDLVLLDRTARWVTTSPTTRPALCPAVDGRPPRRSTACGRPASASGS
jgi:glycosyltransferase involved in cell wall biosynthesis